MKSSLTPATKSNGRKPVAELEKLLPIVMDGLEPLRCSSCGRFMGVARIQEGELYPHCGNCKTFTVFLFGKAQKNILTAQQLVYMLQAGRKVKTPR